MAYSGARRAKWRARRWPEDSRGAIGPPLGGRPLRTGIITTLGTTYARDDRPVLNCDETFVTFKKEGRSSRDDRPEAHARWLWADMPLLVSLRCNALEQAPASEPTVRQRASTSANGVLPHRRDAHNTIHVIAYEPPRRCPRAPAGVPRARRVCTMAAWAGAAGRCLRASTASPSAFLSRTWLAAAPPRTRRPHRPQLSPVSPAPGRSIQLPSRPREDPRRSR